MDFKQWCHSVGIEDFRDVDLVAGEYLREAFEFQQDRLDKAKKFFQDIESPPMSPEACTDCNEMGRGCVPYADCGESLAHHALIEIWGVDSAETAGL